LGRKHRIRKESQPQWKPVRDPAVWEGLRRDFERLREEEVAADPENRHDGWLRGDADGQEENSGKRAQRLQYSLGGGLNEYFTEKFRLASQKAGMALGIGPASDAVENWIAHVFRDAREQKSKLLRGAMPDGSGWISSISEAAAVSCLRLEQQAREAVARNARSKRRKAKKRGSPATARRTKAVATPLRSVEQQPATLPFTHSSDYRSINFNGQRYELTQKQATIIQILHKALAEGTPSIGKAQLLEETQAETARMPDLFKNSPLWKTLIVGGERRGTYRLNLLGAEQNPLL
jgi:hypothetical protein